MSWTLANPLCTAKLGTCQTGCHQWYLLFALSSPQYKRAAQTQTCKICSCRAGVYGVYWHCVSTKLTVSMPSQLTVPAVTEACSSLLTGMGSPVRADSSTLLQPETTTPSTGMRSPGNNTSRSPGATFSEGTWRHWPSASSRRAFGGRSPCEHQADDDFAMPEHE